MLGIVIAEYEIIYRTSKKLSCQNANHEIYISEAAVYVFRFAHGSRVCN